MPNLSEILIYTGETPLILIIWSLFIGVAIAAIISYIVKVKFGAFMQTLLKINANSPETAVSLEETGLSKSIFVKIGLKLRSNYKNLMVAITDDGIFYANDIYTPDPPIFKEFVFIRRKRKSKLMNSEKAEEKTTENNEEVVEESAISKRIRLENEREAAKEPTPEELEAEDNNQKLEEYIKYTENLPRERVKFDIKTAKFYIPPELHDRAASIYISKPMLFVHVLIGLLGFAIVALFAENIITLLTDFLNDFISGLGGSSNTL